jgi:ABC-type transporter Mla subunit MlaD
MSEKTPSERIAETLTAAISEFDQNLSEILKKAFDEGGDAQVLAVVQARQSLIDARWEIRNKQLEEALEGLSKITKEFRKEAENLQKAIDDLKSVADVLNKVAQVVGLVGRILINFGI